MDFENKKNDGILNGTILMFDCIIAQNKNTVNSYGKINVYLYGGQMRIICVCVMDWRDEKRLKTAWLSDFEEVFLK